MFGCALRGFLWDVDSLLVYHTAFYFFNGNDSHNCEITEPLPCQSPAELWDNICTHLPQVLVPSQTGWTVNRLEIERFAAFKAPVPLVHERDRGKPRWQDKTHKHTFLFMKACLSEHCILSQLQKKKTKNIENAGLNAVGLLSAWMLEPQLLCHGSCFCNSVYWL